MTLGYQPIETCTTPLAASTVLGGHMLIELDFPPARLNPNNRYRCHHAHARVVKKYRHECKLLTQQQCPAYAGPYDLLVTFHPPIKRHRDKDNLIAAFKAGQDGIADAWDVDDSLFNFEYVIGEEVKNGKTTITRRKK